MGNEKMTMANNISRNPKMLWLPGIIRNMRMFAATSVRATKFERITPRFFRGGSSLATPLWVIFSKKCSFTARSMDGCQPDKDKKTDFGYRNSEGTNDP